MSSRRNATVAVMLRLQGPWFELQEIVASHIKGELILIISVKAVYNVSLCVENADSTISRFAGNGRASKGRRTNWSFGLDARYGFSRAWK